MQHVVHALHRPPARLEPGDIPPDEADTIADVTQVLAPARREIVEHGDFRTVAHQALDEM